jgi:hypothetical protein
VDANEMVLISIHHYIIEPTNMFDRHMPAKCKAQALCIDGVADYPHSDSTRPRRPETLLDEMQAGGWTGAEIDANTWQTAHAAA